MQSKGETEMNPVPALDASSQEAPWGLGPMQAQTRCFLLFGIKKQCVHGVHPSFLPM
ncbi:hypothetical protein BDA96_01G052500 [Sorghum bicolor]|uniref:Uncharacterized protein n=1 Tax=Sorghum bicolor TaxID=4558 RepID=A0A921RWY0_SORBI|nr:hypothetical protein BDA96_01G052500 [Sorghum bicolor]